MNVLRKIALGIGGIVAVALVLSLAAPKTAQALVSALVTVANTSANPVPTKAADNPALKPFHAEFSCSADAGNNYDCEADQGLLVPLGMTAVMQYFSGQCRTPGNVTPANTAFGAVNGDGTPGGTIRVTVIGPPPSGSPLTYTFGGPATLYGVSTSAAQARLGFGARLFDAGSCDVFIIGYYVQNGQ